MDKNILIINSSPKGANELYDLWLELKKKSYSFNLWYNNIHDALFLNFQKEGWATKKIFLGPKLNNKFKIIIFVLLYPLLLIINLWRLLFLKNINTLILLNWNEKIIFSPLARLLKRKTIWLQLPGCNCLATDKWLVKFIKLVSKKVRIISFTEFTKNQLSVLGISNSNHMVITPGINLNYNGRQENIFNELAESSKKNFRNKFFTIGTIAQLDHAHKIEVLLAAIKECSGVIENLQLVVVGEGEEKKNLYWLAKKMNIDSLVWFVGQQQDINKWLSGLSAFISTNSSPTLEDLKMILSAQSRAIPVIGLSTTGMEDIIENNKTGVLVETNTGDAFAQKIIELEQNRDLGEKIGLTGQKNTIMNYTLEKMATKFYNVLN
jgi:glycosyltransferase involved in cell wall biosynthesis